MLIKKAIALCKSNDTILLYRDKNGVQWLSDGACLLPLHGYPIFDDESVCRTFDIADAKKDKMNIELRGELPEVYDTADRGDFENLCELGSMAIISRGVRAIPVQSSHGTVFFDSRYLDIFGDVERDALGIFERTTDEGQVYFAVKNGFMLVGLIMPADLISESFVAELEKLAKRARVSLENRTAK